MVRSSVASFLIALAACGGAPRPAVVPPPDIVAPPPATVSPPPAPLVAPEGVRLPRTLAIEHGVLALDIDPARATMGGVATFIGTLAAPTPVLWLHAEKLTIARAVATPTTLRGPNIPADPPVTLEVITGVARGRVALRAPTPLAPGAYMLTLDYTAQVDATESEGTFRQQLDGRWYAFTQHEPISARRSFPCLDEPDLKIPWTVSLTVPDGMLAVANAPELGSVVTADGRRTFTFAPTEAIPSYLVAYAVGPFEVVPAGTSSGGAPIRIITPHGKAAEAGFAVESTPKLLAAFERWFGTPYPFAKLDSIAIPTTVGFGAMENPGLITYTERLLLMPADAPEARKRRYAVVGAHELAHQWFGNLVTPAWWDDIWLNESFATWMPRKILDEVYPEFVWDEDDVIARGNALGGDSLSTARRIRQPIASEDDIVNAFDGITYGKGAAVLRMIEAWIHPDRLQRGVRAYMAKHARGNATAADFVSAIAAEATELDVEGVFASFLDQAGAPRIEATVDCTGRRPTMTLSQRRYRPTGAANSDDRTRWRLPVCVVSGAGERGTTCEVLVGDTLDWEMSICPRWVWPNASARGYYRAGMTAAAWSALRTEGWRHLDRRDRLAAAQDLAAAIAAGEVGVEIGLAWVPALLAEKSTPALQLAVEPIWGVRPWVKPGEQKKFAAWVDRLLGARARALGWLPRAKDTIDDEDDRGAIVPLLATLGDRELGKKAVALAADWRSLPEGPRRGILQAAVRADATVHDRLLADLRSEKNHGRAGDLAAALGVVGDPARLRAALALTLDPALDIRDVAAILWAALASEPQRTIAEAFAVDNFDALLARMPEEWGAGLVGTLTTSCDAAKVAPMRALADAKLAGRLGAQRRIDQAFERMGQCVAQRATVEPAVARWLTTLR